MSKSLNKVLLLGHLGKDPEIRTAAGGTLIANLSIATTESRKTKEGKWEDVTEWHSLLAFARTAEVCRDYLTKGSHVLIEGKLQTQKWDDKETGEKRYKTQIIVTDLTMLGGRTKQEAAAASTEPNIHSQHITDADVPF